MLRMIPIDCLTVPLRDYIRRLPQTATLKRVYFNIMSKKIDFKETFKYCNGELTVVLSILFIAFLGGILTAIVCKTLSILIVSLITPIFIIIPFAIDLAKEKPHFWVIKNEDNQ